MLLLQQIIQTKVSTQTALSLLMTLLTSGPATYFELISSDAKNEATNLYLKAKAKVVRDHPVLPASNSEQDVTKKLLARGVKNSAKNVSEVCHPIPKAGGAD